MKIELLIILFTLSILFPVSDIFAPPSANPDWQSYPYCPGGCSYDYLKEEWAKYYDLKGANWMEIKRQEMFSSIENGTLDEWLDEPTRAHRNVHTYYFFQGEVSNYEGKFIDHVIQEKFFSDMEHNLKNNQFQLGAGMTINFTFLLIIIMGTIVGIVFLIRKTRK